MTGLSGAHKAGNNRRYIRKNYQNYNAEQHRNDKRHGTFKDSAQWDIFRAFQWVKLLSVEFGLL